ncbi:hypothetical protein [Shewanella glacialimarina]|uniref:hypothetical protein n=1 Tax=Shewanella glacialimarina TaxID=2590884 RepID=UPI001CF82AB9|nr:hypothetical protein [Shewanella glacialimarina]UCX03541.1 hypothetical protein FJ709_02795 [Shewanella glacialimarina]
MSQLTQKQIKARAYYQENRERILADKRSKHESKRKKPAVLKVTRSKPVAQQPTVTKADIEWDGQAKVRNGFNSVINEDSEYRNRKAINKAISAQGKINTTARRKAEDIKLADELGINVEDFV